MRPLALCLAGLLFATSAPAQPLPRITAPVYGNWCGPGHPADIPTAPPPIDPLDAACQRHDYCYAARGRNTCGCDLALLQELRTTRWPTPALQQNARAIYDAMALVPCDNPQGMASKETLFAFDLLTDMLGGRATPQDVPRRWWQLLGGN